jgi:5-methylcytosine-specific restriction endonuclease McrA
MKIPKILDVSYAYDTDGHLNKEQKHKARGIWSKHVKKRDKNKCQCCGASNITMDAHHILSFSRHEEFKWDISNGITLCRRCHTKFHKLFGYFGFDSMDLLEFITVEQSCLQK